MNAREILAAARLMLHRKVPYLSSIAFALRLVERPGLRTLVVDAGWRLHYDPAAVEEWGAAGIAAVLVHEVGHCLRRHHDRIGHRGAAKWNISSDAEINDDIEQMGFKLPAEPIAVSLLITPSLRA